MAEGRVGTDGTRDVEWRVMRGMGRSPLTFRESESDVAKETAMLAAAREASAWPFATVRVSRRVVEYGPWEDVPVDPPPSQHINHVHWGENG